MIFLPQVLDVLKPFPRFNLMNAGDEPNISQSPSTEKARKQGAHSQLNPKELVVKTKLPKVKLSIATYL